MKEVPGTDESTKIKSNVNYRVIAAIVVSSIVFQVFNSVSGPPDTFNIFVIIGIAGLAPCFILSFVVAKRYRDSEVFGRAYLALAIAYLLYFVGDSIYYYYDFALQETPYPSIADLFYLAFEPFILYHLVKNIAYFKRRFDIPTIMWMAAMPIAIVASYAYLSYAEMGEFNFDFYYSMIFVTAASIPLPFAILGTLVFRHSILASIWSLLALGISLNIFADVWYYYLELFGQYTDSHPVYVFWIAGYAFVSYALIKHLKDI